MNFRATDISIQIRNAFREIRKPIERAAYGAATDASNLLKTRGRANIAAAGFSKKWQNTWRVNVHPRTTQSIDAAIFAFHRIGYSAVFEEGARIRAKGGGLLWVPLKGTPSRNKKSKPTPSQFISRGINLFTMDVPGEKPLLAGKIRGQGNVTFGRLRSGSRAKRNTRSVPLFIGLPQVTIRKRFALGKVALEVSAILPDLYYKHLNPRK